MKNRYAKTIRLLVCCVSLIVMIALILPITGYGQFKEGQKRTIGEGQKAEIKGVILSRDGETFIVRDLNRADTVVVLTEATKVRTERKGLFRGHKPFDVTVLQPGLILTVEGKGDSQGRLVAGDITFTEADLKAAITGYVQTKKLATETDKQFAETRQEVAETNKRISSLDQYDVVKTVAVYFDVNSDKLKPEAKALLDELASKAPGAKNYMVEIKGYADPTGNADKNIALSQRRAQAVVDYLALKHNVPLRRMTMPMGYGEIKAGEGATAADRAKDRRVDVTVMVNKGLAQ